MQTEINFNIKIRSTSPLPEGVDLNEILPDVKFLVLQQLSDSHTDGVVTSDDIDFEWESTEL